MIRRKTTDNSLKAPRAMTELECRYADLVARAREGDARAQKICQQEFGLRFYTTEEIDSFVAQRPELTRAAVLGHDHWDHRTPHGM